MFRKHLSESGKTYLEHGRFAIKAGGLLLWAGFTSIVHGLLPNLFPFVSRDIVLRLADQSRPGHRKSAEASGPQAKSGDVNEDRA